MGCDMDHGMGCECGGEAALQERLNAPADLAQLRQSAASFVDFVLRHTLPERATAHGAETVYSIIKHHPFAKAHGSDGIQKATPND